MLQDCNLVSAMETKQPIMSMNSTKKSDSKTIDHILSAQGTETTITKCGQLPFKLGFDTNHQAVFTDMKLYGLLQLLINEPVVK